MMALISLLVVATLEPCCSAYRWTLFGFRTDPPNRTPFSLSVIRYLQLLGSDKQTSSLLSDQRLDIGNPQRNNSCLNYFSCYLSNFEQLFVRKLYENNQKHTCVCHSTSCHSYRIFRRNPARTIWTLNHTHTLIHQLTELLLGSRLRAKHCQVPRMSPFLWLGVSSCAYLI